MNQRRKSQKEVGRADIVEEKPVWKSQYEKESRVEKREAREASMKKIRG